MLRGGVSRPRWEHHWAPDASVQKEGLLRIGTWNVSGWSAAKMRACWPDIQVEVLAIQETHLAVIPVQWAHTKMREVS